MAFTTSPSHGAGYSSLGDSPISLCHWPPARQVFVYHHSTQKGLATKFCAISRPCANDRPPSTDRTVGTLDTASIWNLCHSMLPPTFLVYLINYLRADGLSKNRPSSHFFISVFCSLGLRASWKPALPIGVLEQTITFPISVFSSVGSRASTLIWKPALPIGVLDKPPWTKIWELSQRWNRGQWAGPGSAV